MSNPETPFVETEVLLALLNDDEERAVSLLSGMTPRERSDLEAVVLTMRRLTAATSWCPGCNEYLNREGDVIARAGGDRAWWHEACKERHEAAIQHANDTVKHTLARSHTQMRR